MDKPRVRFCWECGRKLSGYHFEEIEVEGFPRICHKACAKNIREGNRDRNIDFATIPENDNDGWRGV